jgi:hypothetical protein
VIRRPPPDDGIVDRTVRPDTRTCPLMIDVQCHTVLDPIVAIEERAPSGTHVLWREFGEEANAPEVDTGHRHAVWRGAPRRADKRAVTAETQHDVCVPEQRAHGSEIPRGNVPDVETACTGDEHSLVSKRTCLGPVRATHNPDATRSVHT